METQPKPVILINAFEVPRGADEAFLHAWERARDCLRTQPGYVSTALHQSIAPQADFRFINVGQWASAAEFRAAVESRGFQQTGRLPYPAHPALYRVVRH